MSFEPTEPQDGVDPNMFTLIDPDAIPCPLTDVWSLNYAAQTLRTGGEDIAGGAEDMRSTWRGLQAHYSAPESEALFAKMDPVVTRGEDVGSDLGTVADALEDLAEAAQTARRKLNTLKIQAQGFWNRHHDKKVWWLTKDDETDDWALLENVRLKDEVNTAWAAFNEAENDCASRISALFGGPSYASPGQADGDGVLVYGLPADAGERDLSLETALSFEGFDSFLNDASAWAGSEFHPSRMDIGNDAGQAVWDTVVTDVLWGSAVGLVATSGLWHPDHGWQTSLGGRWQNLKSSAKDAGLDLVAFVGVHDDHGWLWEPGEGGREGWGAGWDRWTDNLDATKDELVEGHTAWSTREEGVAYSNATIGANAVLLTGGLPLKLAKSVLGLGPGGSAGTPSSSDGSYSNGSATGGRPGTGNWPSSPLPGAGQGRRPAGERFGDFLEELDSPLIGPPGRGPEAPSYPSSPLPGNGDGSSPQSPNTPRGGGTTEPQGEGAPPARPRGEESSSGRGGEESGAPAPASRPEGGSQSGGTGAPRAEESSERRPPRGGDDGASGGQGDGRSGGRDDDREGTGGPREEAERPAPATGGGGEGGGGDEPPRTGTGGDDDNGDNPESWPHRDDNGQSENAQSDGGSGDTGGSPPDPAHSESRGEGGDLPPDDRERLLDVFPNRVDTEGLLPNQDQTKPPTGRANPRSFDDIANEGLIGPGWKHFSDKEIRIAEFLRGHGIEVESIKESTVDGVRTPEAAISGTGETVEFKVLESDSARSFERNIRSARGQSRRMVFDVRHLGTSQESAVQGIGKGLFHYGGDLSEVVVIGDEYTIVWP